MKKPSKIMLQNEAIVQSLFVVPMSFLYLLAFIETDFIVFGLIIQFFLGIFQIISAIVRVLLYRSIIRKRYLFAVLIFVILGYLAAIMMDTGVTPNVEYFFWILGLIIVPVSFSLFYFIFTLLQGLGKFYEVDLPEDLWSEDSDNVIDEIMISNHS